MKIAKLAQPLAIAVGGITLCLLAAFRADAQVEVTVNGSAVDIAPPAITQAGRVFVPLRGVFEQLGASVDYANGTIDANGNGRDRQRPAATDRRRAVHRRREHLRSVALHLRSARG
jgi:hypothetical protein